jgi:hypothetical protein
MPVISNVRPHLEDASPSLTFRLGASLLAALVGLVPGFIVAIGFAIAGAFPSVSFAAWVFGFPVVLGVFSFFVPAFAFALFPAVAHAFFGAAKQATEQAVSPSTFGLPEPELSTPRYLKVSFYAGAVAVVVIAVLFS